MSGRWGAKNRRDTMWTKVFRREALHRQNGRCAYCRDVLSPRAATADHVVPRANGGLHHGSNIKASCRNCNMMKSSRSEGEFRKLIRHPPANSLEWLLLNMRFRLNRRTELAVKRIRNSVTIQQDMV